MAKKKSALILGATGLVGSRCLDFLLKDSSYSRVFSLARRSLNIKHEKLTEYIIDFKLLGQHPDKFKVDSVFCCLGTTIRAAGSRENFKEVDYAYPLKAGRMSLKNGVKSFAIVTALGADRNSKIFYNRVKGEIEMDLIALNLNNLLIFRPSMLVGRRRQFRLGEKIGNMIMILLNPILSGRLKKYRRINCRAVAGVMLAETEKNLTGMHIYESHMIIEKYNRWLKGKKSERKFGS